MGYKKSELTGKIIEAFYNVYNELGYGFLETVYANALKEEFLKLGLKAINEKPIKVYYNNKVIGEYYSDFLVDGEVVIEIKAIKELKKIDEVQIINYLKSTDKEIGLLVNFGPELEVKRKIFSNK